MIEYAWTIPQTDYTFAADGTIDKVTRLHWRCKATEGEATATSYGTVGVPEDDPAANPSNLPDEASAIAAAKRLLGTDVEASLASQLDVQAAPTQGSGRIWDIPAGTKAWRAGESVAVDDVRVYQGTPYTALQAHTTERGWTPDVTPALWTPERDMQTGPQPWVQPTGAQDAYNTGDQVTHDNPNDGGTIWVYESAIDANTTEPGRDGTFDRWWTPIEAT